MHFLSFFKNVLSQIGSIETVAIDKLMEDRDPHFDDTICV